MKVLCPALVLGGFRVAERQKLCVSWARTCVGRASGASERHKADQAKMSSAPLLLFARLRFKDGPK